MKDTFIKAVEALIGDKKTVKTDSVSRVVLVPQNEEIEYTYENGVCRFTVGKFACSQAVAIYRKKGRCRT